MAIKATDTGPAWPSEIYACLKEYRVRQISYVPDAGHSRLITMAHDDPDMIATVLTTEEEGIALSAGAWLGGDRAALLMQSSGVGNCINMLSLMATCRFPLLTLVTMRGEWAEFNPWQVPMGQATPGVLRMMGVTVMRVDRAEHAAETVSAAAALAYEGDQQVAVLLSQKMIGRKQWVGKVMAAFGTLDRRAAVASLLTDRGGLLVVSGLGSPTYDVFAAGDHDANFYLWGAMGGAALMGLGLALAQPARPVAVVTGDGEQLMGVGGLLTIAVKRPGNLTIVILDNGHFGETGMQMSHSGHGVDLAAIARSAGFKTVKTITTPREVVAARGMLQGTTGGPRLLRVQIAPGETPRALPARDGVYLKTRFRKNLGYAVS